MSVEPGQSLLHYRIVEKLGEGGMGAVWKATDTTLDRAVAIKVLPENFAADPDRLGRFEREAKLLASVNHTNIATIHGMHVTPEGLRFLAMAHTAKLARPRYPLLHVTQSRSSQTGLLPWSCQSGF